VEPPRVVKLRDLLVDFKMGRCAFSLLEEQIQKVCDLHPRGVKRPKRKRLETR